MGDGESPREAAAAPRSPIEEGEGGAGKRTRSLARAAEPLNPKRTAAGDWEREVIAISELATSAEPQAATPGKGRVRCSGESAEPQRHGGRGA